MSDEVEEKYQDPGGKYKREPRENEVQGVPAEITRIGVDPPWHAAQPRDMHREEGAVEADEHEPKGPAPKPFGKHPPRDERRPVIKCGKKRENHSSSEHVVEVCHDEIGVVNLPVVRYRRHHDAGQPADCEDE